MNLQQEPTWVLTKTGQTDFILTKALSLPSVILRNKLEMGGLGHRRLEKKKTLMSYFTRIRHPDSGLNIFSSAIQ